MSSEKTWTLEQAKAAWGIFIETVPHGMRPRWADYATALSEVAARRSQPAPEVVPACAEFCSCRGVGGVGSGLRCQPCRNAGCWESGSWSCKLADRAKAKAGEPAWPFKCMHGNPTDKPCAQCAAHDMAEQPAAPSVNQCDGCRRGLPVADGWIHRGEGGPWDVIACTADRYKVAAPPAPVAEQLDAGDLFSGPQDVSGMAALLLKQPEVKSVDHLLDQSHAAPVVHYEDCATRLGTSRNCDCMKPACLTCGEPVNAKTFRVSICSSGIHPRTPAEPPAAPAVPQPGVPAGFVLGEGWHLVSDNDADWCDVGAHDATAAFTRLPVDGKMLVCRAHAETAGAIVRAPVTPAGVQGGKPLSERIRECWRQGVFPGEGLANDCAALEARLAETRRLYDKRHDDLLRVEEIARGLSVDAADLRAQLATRDARIAGLEASSADLVRRAQEAEEKLSLSEAMAKAWEEEAMSWAKDCEALRLRSLEFDRARASWSAARKYLVGSRLALAQALDARIIARAESMARDATVAELRGKLAAAERKFEASQALAEEYGLAAVVARRERDEAMFKERARVNGWWAIWRAGLGTSDSMPPAERDAGIASGAPAPEVG